MPPFVPSVAKNPVHPERSEAKSKDPLSHGKGCLEPEWIRVLTSDLDKSRYVWRTMGDMATLTFDTHDAVKALRDAGFAEAEAEAVVRTVGGP